MKVILVLAEGENANREAHSLREFFASRGFEVSLAASSQQAHSLLEQHVYNYALIDLEVDGEAADLCRTIRQQAESETYSLVLPAAENAQSLRAALAAGADDYLPKPVQIATLQLRLALADRRLAARRQVHQTRARLEQAEKRLRFREQYFRSLLESSSDLITVVDREGHILYQSASSGNLLGFGSEEMMGWNLLEHLHPDDRGRFIEGLEKALDDPAVTPSVQCRLRRRKGDFRYFEALVKNLCDDEVVGGVVVTSRNIAEHRRLESELRRERTFFQQLLRNSPTGIVILDPEDRIIDANRAFLALFGFEMAEIKKKKINDCVVPEELGDEAVELSRRVFEHETVEHETTRQKSDGSAVEVSIIGYPIEIGKRLIGAFGIYSDITQRKTAERQLYHHAYHDALTGLPNRTLLKERLERALRRVEQQPGYRFALLFLDLDRFKVINDSLGHEAGDELLVEMARRLESAVRPGDTVARLGGDEFTVILEGLGSPEDATAVASRMLESLSEPFNVGGEVVATSGSIGVAYSAPGYASADEIVRDADIAMYRAKTAGKARYEIFDAAMHERAMTRLQLESELRQAIEGEELILHYQPLVSLSTRRVVGFEALVRWQHPRRGFMKAADFIPICEETGLIVPLGRWALRQAALQVVDWQARHPASDCRVTVNLSAKETAHAEFFTELDRICEETGVQPGSLGLELAESLMSQETDDLAETLWELSRRGFRLYVDDFGTGHASLSALHRYPIDSLKIDRSFVEQMSPGGESLEIARAIAVLGESLGMTVVAEGIETEEQLAQVRKLDVPYAQGFFFGRPVAVEEAEKMLLAGELWEES